MDDEKTLADKAGDFLYGAPVDPKDVPRAVHLQRMIDARRRWMWLWGLFLGAPAVGAALYFTLEGIKYISALQIGTAQ